MDLETVLAVLRARLVLIVFCLVLGAGSAYGFSKLQDPMYTASAKLLFRAPELDQQASGVFDSGYRDQERETATNISLVKVKPIAERAARKLGGGVGADQVLASVNVTPEGSTDLAAVQATALDPELAARIANIYTEEFIERRREIDEQRIMRARDLVERRIAQLSEAQRQTLQGQSLIERSESLRILASLQTGNAEIVERAVPPVVASSPNVRNNTILGGLFGLLLGLGLALLIHRLDRRIKTPEDVSRIYKLPLLGVVPVSDAFGAKGNRLPAREGEAFRMLRAHLRYFNVDHDMRSVLITSAAAGEGKSTVALYLAQAAASMGTRTLLIEGDLRRPTLASRLALPPGAGLGEVLISAVEPADAIRTIGVDIGVNGAGPEAYLDVLLVGGIPPNPAELIESHAMENLLSWAGDHYGLVIVDTPPLTVVSDAIPILRKVDGVLIVSRLGVSTLDAAEQLRDRLASLGAPTLGVVGNAYEEKKFSYYGYGAYEPLEGPPAAPPDREPVGSGRTESY